LAQPVFDLAVWHSPPFLDIVQAPFDLLESIQFIHDIVICHVFVESFNELKRDLFCRFRFRRSEEKKLVFILLTVRCSLGGDA